jgi:uncharacterized protein (DUF4415 family)
MKPKNSKTTVEAENAADYDFSVEDDPEFSDPYNIPDDFWEGAVLVDPNPKETISIRLDNFVLSYFREGGRGYQKRINNILHHYVLTQRLEEARRKGRQEAIVEERGQATKS